jgi:micrococcal nuclease
MRGILALVLASSPLLPLTAVDEAAVVAAVIDGDTIEVEDGRRVRLLYIDTPESRDNSHGEAMAEGKAATAFLHTQLPRGTAVTLRGPGARLQQDRYERTLAVVVVGGRTAQEQIISAGWSPYWRKYGDAAAWDQALDAQLIFPPFFGHGV